MCFLEAGNMYNNLNIPGIDKKTRRDIKAFFENTLNDVSLHVEEIGRAHV